MNVRTHPHAAGDSRSPQAFRHEALFYAGLDEFAQRTLPFIRDGLEAGDPTLVVVDARKIALLRSELGDYADTVLFADMADVGANPARIIPAWRRFVDAHAADGRELRGIGEPIHPERRSAELVECQRHESLLNVAFGDAEDFWLVCPYDTEALGADVIEEARRSHPFLADGHRVRTSADYRGLHEISAPFDVPLPEPASGTTEVPFDQETLRVVRDVVVEHAARMGFSAERTEDLVLAVHELATNSIRHAGGEGVLRVWADHESLICEVRDRGLIRNPLVGRELPPEEHHSGGYGLWMANQLCELVQVRSGASGTVVRLHMRAV